VPHHRPRVRLEPPPWPRRKLHTRWRIDLRQAEVLEPGDGLRIADIGPRAPAPRAVAVRQLVMVATAEQHIRPGARQAAAAAATTANRGRRNIACLELYQVIVRVGWISKTETIIMPAAAFVPVLLDEPALRPAATGWNVASLLSVGHRVVAHGPAAAQFPQPPAAEDNSSSRQEHHLRRLGNSSQRPARGIKWFFVSIKIRGRRWRYGG